MFTGITQRVEFTSKHMHEVSTEPNINDVDQSEQVSEQLQKRNASPEPEEHKRGEVRRVLTFDAVSPLTSPYTEDKSTTYSRDPFKQGTTPHNANDPYESQLYYPPNPSPTHDK